MKIAGITRYSVIFLKSFAATRGRDLASAQAVIWHPERLDHRERLFRALALPSLEQIARRHSAFAHIMLVSRGFPDPWVSTLREMAAARPWLHIALAEPGEDFSAAKPVLREFVGADRAFVFRLDDDDALSPDVYLEAVLGNGASPDGTVLSPDRGHMIRPAWSGVSLRPEFVPFVSSGLGVYTSGPDPLSIHDLGNQNKIANRGNPVVHFDGDAWLRTKHETSDTAMHSWKRWRYIPTQPRELARFLDEHFPGLDADAVVAAVLRRQAAGA